MNAPVFLVGPVRSGSTLLRLMLDFHPDITNPGECDFLFDKVGDSGNQPDVNDYVQWLSTDRIFHARGLTIDSTLGMHELHQSFIGQFKTPDKVLTLNVHRNFHRIPFVYPEARYIHLLRDPRDVARSCIGMGWVGNTYFGADIWQDAEASWDRLKAKLSPVQYLEVRYEDLLEDVVAGLTTVCKFLGLEYSERMLDYAENSTYGLPDKSLSFQWKRKYSDRELRLVEGKLGHMIADRGYELSGQAPVTPSALEYFYLSLENRRRRVQHQINKYGVSTYLEGLAVRRLKIESWRDSHKRRMNSIDTAGLK